MAQVSVSGFICSEVKTINDKLCCVRLSERFYNGKTKQREKRYWDVLFRGEKIKQHVQNGQHLAVSGNLNVGVYNGKEQLSVFASMDAFDFTFPPRGEEKNEDNDDRQIKNTTPPDDDVPF